VGVAVGNWVIGTLVYFVILAVVFGAVTGTMARFAVEFALGRKWINTEGYLLFPTALGVSLTLFHLCHIACPSHTRHSAWPLLL